MYLFRITVKGDVYSRYYLKKIKPYYIIAESRNAAKSKLETHLPNGVRIHTITYLGGQCSGILFSGNVEETP